MYVFFSNRIICKMLLKPPGALLGATGCRAVRTPAVLTLTLDFREKLQ